MPRGGARIGAGRKPNPKPVAPMADAPVTREASAIDWAGANRTPLQYMLAVMNDPGADEKIRAQMAVAAAPYVHGKIGETGKREGKNEAAKKAGTGKFGAASVPLKLVG